MKFKGYKTVYRAFFAEDGKLQIYSNEWYKEREDGKESAIREIVLSDYYGETEKDAVEKTLKVMEKEIEPTQKRIGILKKWLEENRENEDED